MKKNVKVLSLAILGLLILGSPGQDQFQKRIMDDFDSSHHGGSKLNQDDLRAIGNSHYQSYLLFSTYEYSFGNITVRYVGIAFMILNMGSDFKETTNKKNVRFS